MMRLACLLTALLLAAPVLAADDADEHASHHPAPAADDGAGQRDNKAGPANRLQKNMQAMEDLMVKIRETADAAEKKRLLGLHMQAMQEQIRTIRTAYAKSGGHEHGDAGKADARQGERAQGQRRQGGRRQARQDDGRARDDGRRDDEEDAQANGAAHGRARATSGAIHRSRGSGGRRQRRVGFGQVGAVPAFSADGACQRACPVCFSGWSCCSAWMFSQVRFGMGRSPLGEGIASQGLRQAYDVDARFSIRSAR